MTAPTNVMFMACGSFSPPTHMHMRMFELARDHFRELGHHVMGGIVSPVHDAYGKKGLVAAKHRSAMVKLALQSSKWVRLSDWECKEQQQWTKTRQSLQYHQNYLNSYLHDTNGSSNAIIPSWMPDDISASRCTGSIQLKLLCGADLLESFAVPGLWKASDIEAILQQHGLVVISRSGSNPEKFIFESDVLTQNKRHITIVTNWVANEVSSSIARRLISRSLSVKYLLDDGVIDYIQQNELYGHSSTTNNTKYILSPNQNTILSVSDQRNNAINTIATTTPNTNKDVQLNIVNYRYDDLMDETDFSTFPTPDIPQQSSAPGGSSSNPMDQALRSTRVFCCGDALNGKSLLPRPGGAVQVVAGSAPPQRRYESYHGPDEVGEKSSTCAAPKAQTTVARRQPSIKANGTSAHTTQAAASRSSKESQSTLLSSSEPPFALPPQPPPSSSATHLLVADHKGRVQFLSDNHLDELGRGSSSSSDDTRNPPVEGGAAEAAALAGRMSSSSGADDDEEEDVSAESMPSTSDRTQDDLIQFVFTSHGIRVISDKEYVV